MADSASTLEAQQQRALYADTFAQRQAQQPDAGEYIRRQASGLGTSLDSINSNSSLQTAGAPALSQDAGPAQAAAGQNDSGPIARLRHIGEMRKQAAQAVASGQALAKANAAYTRVLNSFQSELIGNALALEIIVSPWLFLSIFFMRIMAAIVPLRMKGIVIFPKYSLGLVGIGVFISHLAAAFVILTILAIIVFFLMFIVWIITADPITQSQVFLDLSSGALKAVWDLFSCGSSGGTGASGTF